MGRVLSLLLRSILVLVASLFLLIAISVFFRVDVTLPYLLWRLPAAGGWMDACPLSRDWPFPANIKLGDSPEFDRRLQARFPSGSKEDDLISELDRLGFVNKAICEGDPSIHYVIFEQNGLRLALFPMTAKVYWKTDKARRIAWVKGFVEYHGL
jgi:hypothetical protein